MPKEVKAAVDRSGQVALEWFNFQGASCLEESKRLHALLAAKYGIKVQETNFVAKPELLQADPEAVQQRQREAQQNG